MHYFLSVIAGTSLKFEIPESAADNMFSIDPVRGIVSTRGKFDRETKSEYRLPVFVMDTQLRTSKGKNMASDLENIKFDMATILIRILDENDNPPQFAAGSCYPLAVPENNELAVIHTVAAFDLDEGVNGEIVYSITGGNVGNKFSIDMNTGELSVRPLDREQQHKYLIQITAQDRGSSMTLQSKCNISVIVEDQNDNDPRFELSKYTASIPEDIAIGSTVLKVRATDSDFGVNGRIMYSLSNESHWLFTIDNKSGVISTTGTFDRERESVYEFAVIATDGGKYNSRSQQVPVQVVINDVNDNKPMFDRYPFTAQVPALIQPGQTIMQVSASDLDQGTNGEIFYSLVKAPANDRFRLNPTSGVLSAQQSLATENGRILYIEIMATDKGNPSLTARGLIELRVGEISVSYPKLMFRNDSYAIRLPEHAAKGSVMLLQAVRTDGRRTKVTYALGDQKDTEAFAIDSETGQLNIFDPNKLDSEFYQNRKLQFTVIAKSEGDAAAALVGFAMVAVELEDINDNAPQFTQRQYSTNVWEGNNKGTFVFQVHAFDADFGLNAKVLYHIVDGNHDNAFIIEPAFSGILKTNIVLDREIRDSYRLKVIATDEGIPQMTGTSTVLINIIDINDNQPTFPPHNVINVSEGKHVGK